MDLCTACAAAGAGEEGEEEKEWCCNSSSTLASHLRVFVCIHVG